MKYQSMMFFWITFLFNFSFTSKASHKEINFEETDIELENWKQKNHQIVFTPASLSPIKHVFFDLNGVLFKTDKKKIFTRIGSSLPSYLVGKICSKKILLPIKEHYLEMLSSIDFKGNVPMSYHKDKEMPKIMRAWLTGEDVHQLVNDSLLANKELKSSFKQMAIAIASNVFNPENFIESQKIISKGFMILKGLKKAGYKVYATSNWDAQSFPLLVKKFPELMNLFDNVYISGQEGTIKPNVDYFQGALGKFKIEDPNECLFLDDEKENIAGAKKTGIVNGVLFKSRKLKSILHKLEEAQVLTQLKS